MQLVQSYENQRKAPYRKNSEELFNSVNFGFNINLDTCMSMKIIQKTGGTENIKM